MSEQKPLHPVTPGTDVSLVGENHLRLYLQTNGEQGYLWNGVPILVLTTKGRKSGETRQIPIIFSRDGDNYFIIGSKGGSPTHPAWYLNLVADPHVQVQVKGDKFDAVARTAESPERERLWAIALKDWPNYDVYQSRTTRQIPVVVLERKPG
jgi:deazaflavin-dependent oxidoreductase (nitroreductase family)